MVSKNMDYGNGLGSDNNKLPLDSDNPHRDTKTHISDINDTCDTHNTTGGQFSLLRNGRKYKDYSTFGILKKLLNEHKINRYQYKESIQRIRAKKPLRESIKKAIFYYLHTIKSNSAKCTFRKIEQQAKPSHKRFMPVLANNGLCYATYIKKPIYQTLLANKWLYNQYKELLITKIKEQLNEKIEQDNKLISIGEDTKN